MAAVAGRSTQALECMEQPENQRETQTLSERLISEVVSAFVKLFMVVFAPFIITVIAHGGTSRGALPLYSRAYIWGTALIVVACVLGFALGPRRMASFWGHLWFTEQPSNPVLSAWLWLAVLAVIGVSYWAN